jgi:periplasmic protein TonB
MVAALNHAPGPYLANDRLKEAYSAWLWGSITFAVLLHFAVLSLGAIGSIPVWQREAAPPMEIVVPPAPPLPPPPEAIARPVVPTLSFEVSDPTITIDPFDFSRPIPAPPPPPVHAPVGGDEMPWVPRDLEPRLLNQAEVERVLYRSYPTMLRNAGIGGTVAFHAFVGVDGRIAEARLVEGSGFAELDRAAERVLQQMRFSPAKNRDRSVAVWVRIPVTFRVQP